MCCVGGCVFCASWRRVGDRLPTACSRLANRVRPRLTVFGEIWTAGHVEDGQKQSYRFLLQEEWQQPEADWCTGLKGAFVRLFTPPDAQTRNKKKLKPTTWILTKSKYGVQMNQQLLFWPKRNVPTCWWQSLSSLSLIVLTETFFNVIDSPKTIFFRCCNNIVIIYDIPQEAIDEVIDAFTEKTIVQMKECWFCPNLQFSSQLTQTCVAIGIIHYV